MSSLVRALLLQDPGSLGEMPLEAGFSHKALHRGLQTNLLWRGMLAIGSQGGVSIPLPFGTL